MIRGMSVAVVVPAYNEQAWLAQVLDTMPAFVDHVVVVDDASTDRTAEVASARQRLAPAERITVLVHRRNRGFGAAIASGYRHAAERGADVIAVMAGDGQMHPDDLRAVVQPVVDGRADYVKGTRFRHPDTWRHMPKTRMVGSFFLSLLTSAAVGVCISDSQCGYTALAATVLGRINIAQLWPRYGYPNDLIGMLAGAGLRIREVVVRPVYRGQRSGLRARHMLTISALIARVAAKRLWRRRGALRTVESCPCGGD